MEGVPADEQRYSSIAPSYRRVLMMQRWRIVALESDASCSKVNENENRESSMEPKDAIKAIAPDLILSNSTTKVSITVALELGMLVANVATANFQGQHPVKT